MYKEIWRTNSSQFEEYQYVSCAWDALSCAIRMAMRMKFSDTWSTLVYTNNILMIMIFTCIHMSTCTHVFMYTHTYTCIYCIDRHTHTHTHTCIYIHTHTHTQTESAMCTVCLTKDGANQWLQRLGNQAISLRPLPKSLSSQYLTIRKHTYMIKCWTPSRAHDSHHYARKVHKTDIL